LLILAPARIAGDDPVYRGFSERTGISQRREFDLLEPYDGLDAGPVRPEELQSMIALARAAVPGVAIADSTVERVYRQHPQCIFPFRCNGRILGGMALLYLNDDGLDRLLLDELDFSDPDPAVLTEFGETPAALYVWALAARGRAAAGIANVSAWFRREPFARADYYAQPSTQDGARILVQVGFKPTNSFQRSLWTYRRLRNRVRPRPLAELVCAT
jgi:hypothetical protein